MLMPGSHFFVVVEGPLFGLLEWLPMHVVPPAAVYGRHLQRLLRIHVHSDCLQAALCARLLLCLYHITVRQHHIWLGLTWRPMLGNCCDDAIQRPCDVMLCTR